MRREGIYSSSQRKALGSNWPPEQVESLGAGVDPGKEAESQTLVLCFNSVFRRFPIDLPLKNVFAA